MSESELQIQRRLTKAFIDTAPVTLTLRPRNKVKAPSGGFTWQEAVPREPQVMRLIEPATVLQGGTKPIITQDGIQREIVFQLLGEWDSVIGMFDIFEYAGNHYEVLQLLHFNGWEQRASVARHG